MKTGGDGTKLRSKASTSVSMGNSWWEERFLMALFLMLVWGSWRIKRLAFLKFLAVCAHLQRISTQALPTIVIKP